MCKSFESPANGGFPLPGVGGAPACSAKRVAFQQLRPHRTGVKRRSEAHGDGIGGDTRNGYPRLFHSFRNSEPARDARLAGTKGLQASQQG
jgi:hypothetical protein